MLIIVAVSVSIGFSWSANEGVADGLSAASTRADVLCVRGRCLFFINCRRFCWFDDLLAADCDTVRRISPHVHSKLCLLLLGVDCGNPATHV